ncbi:hypothetical protein sos41_09790 [Alphaproteobacteria bacterium SO-S41]|nr:hypothetical protein sos41_09790 [Alphaproteobacteria bacterium SO-S41]
MNLPETVTAQYQPWVRGWWLAVWAFAALLSAVFFYFGLVMGSIVPWLALPITVTGFIALVACAVIFGMVWRRLRLDRDVVTVGPAGYHDIRIGHPVPWSDVVRLVRHQPGTQTALFIEAREPKRFLRKTSRLYKGAARLNPALGFPGLASSLGGLNESSDTIIAAAEAWHAKEKG